MKNASRYTRYLAAGAASWLLLFTTSTLAFAPTTLSSSSTMGVVQDYDIATTSTTALHMANDQDFMRWARAARSASSDDNLVELNRPLGLVLNEDEKGNVYIEKVAPKGNAARTGRVRAVRFCCCVDLESYS
jgi:hypothetical protein